VQRSHASGIWISVVRSFDVRWFVVSCALIMLQRAARADEADELVAKGQALAEQGEWTQAIDRFKAADAARPTAKHACLIGLAYTRRELWPQAELFFARCRNRATAAEPLPTWYAGAMAELQGKLADAGAVAVALAIDPPVANARITLSSFAADEQLEAQTIHLAPGRYVVIAEAPDFQPARREIVVVAGQPQNVMIHLDRRFRPSRVPPGLVIGGAAALAGALAFDAFVLQPARDALAGTNAAYDANLDAFRTKRAVTIGMFAGGAALVLAGVALRFTVYRHREASIQASAGVRDGAALFAVEWRR
jgi:hypothetical protein